MAVFTLETYYSCEMGYPFDNSRQIGNTLERTRGVMAFTPSPPIRFF